MIACSDFAHRPHVGKVILPSNDQKHNFWWIGIPEKSNLSQICDLCPFSTVLFFDLANLHDNCGSARLKISKTLYFCQIKQVMLLFSFFNNSIKVIKELTFHFDSATPHYMLVNLFSLKSPSWCLVFWA